ncbi:outer membrane protein assembly factor BamE [uncultured Thiocystis sp.]|jgi:outer membrane protein assembly factor BamE|uniref:outer membrane protein assembly factor BamE n=1 Tax=uncultured Thiocystis sp. TaxID=1202134 RepID=UPI0025DA1E96|nr:outer membrane protein assembly factor BamE [uncultured Thiocystis sp.]
MRKIFSFPMIGCLVLLAASGCARDRKPEETRASLLEDLPFVYKMTVQQGNILTEEMVDSLELGMTRRQVSFLLGTPLLADFFHGDRWDYAYTIQRGHQPMEKRFLTLYFQDDALARIEGDIRPDAKRGESREAKEIVVSVPDYQERKGLLTRGLQTIGLEPKE